MCTAFIIPNINILITFTGAVLGTIVNIVLPVLFYNRAYAPTPKNRALEKKKDGGDDEEKELLDKKKGKKGEDKDEGEEDKDPRFAIKCCNWVVLACGVTIGIVGLAYVIIQLVEGAHEDEV